MDKSNSDEVCMHAHIQPRIYNNLLIDNINRPTQQVSHQAVSTIKLAPAAAADRSLSVWLC